jgi:hypothetical protein
MTGFSRALFRGAVQKEGRSATKVVTVSCSGDQGEADGRIS